MTLSDGYDEPCRKCGGTMHPSTAIEQTLTGMPDFPGDTRAVTLSPGGSGKLIEGKLIECSKCVSCGHSVTVRSN